MKIAKAELARKLNKMKGVMPKKGSLPILHGILVCNGYLIASNMEMTVKARIEDAEGSKFIIPEQALDLINNLPDGDMEISAKKNHVITIKSGKIRNNYQTMDPEQFPVMTEQKEGSELTIEADVLLESLKRIFYAISPQGSNSVMSSMCLQADDGWLNFVGLDGHVLAWDKVKYDGKFELLIPRNTVEKLRSFGFSEAIKIKYNKLGAVFITEEMEVYTRLVDGNYFKYRTMFQELPLRTIVSRVKLLEAMTRAKMCTEERCPVRFELEGFFLNLSLKGRTADYAETLELQEEIPNALTIGFDARLVLETIKAFDCENVRVSFGGPKMPMLMEAEDSDFKTIVLPVVIN